MINEQPNLQTSTALKIFVDFYGFPSWENNPKEGQNRNEIIKLWNETLKGYSEHQIEEAAFNIVRNQRTMKFPTISHMRAQLFDKSKDAEIQQQLAELKRRLAEPRVETDPIRKRAGSFYVRGRKVLPGFYEDAARRVLNDVRVAYPELRDGGYTELVRKADSLGWLDTGPILKHCAELMGFDEPPSQSEEPQGNNLTQSLAIHWRMTKDDEENF